jgi:hypothetical protein
VCNSDDASKDNQTLLPADVFLETIKLINDIDCFASNLGASDALFAELHSAMSAIEIPSFDLSVIPSLASSFHNSISHTI